jgi:hypothetical protein
MLAEFRRMKLRTRLAVCLRISLAIVLVIFGVAQLAAPAKASAAAGVGEVFVAALSQEVYGWARS